VRSLLTAPARIDSNPNQEGVQIDGRLVYAATDTNSGRKSYITSAAYTNSVADAKTTTNFVIDSNLGILATQGTREGAPNPVSLIGGEDNNRRGIRPQRFVPAGSRSP
jgi:hypothetical protein